MDGEGWGSIPLVAKTFRRYYQFRRELIKAPPEIRSREFAFLSFGSRNMQRHTAFDDILQLRCRLADSAPAHVYYSSAYYEAPEAEMEWKGWIGADLVFDIDADHIESPCKADHDRWRCRACGEEGAGKAPEECPRCGKAAFNEETWFCERCLALAKFEVNKLLDIIIQDFNFSPAAGEVEVNFSGNRGYHVHVRSPDVRWLDQLARREIVDYVMGIGINPEYHGFGVRAGSPNMAEGGWRGRAIKALYDYVAHATPVDLKRLNLGGAATRGILEDRGEILRLLREGQARNVLKQIRPKPLGRLMDTAVKEQASAIDTVVTTDLNRLIRLPNTLHGKTGWLAQTVAIDELEDYDPQNSAVALTGGTETVYVSSAPRFRIGDEFYGPYENERVELPLAAAVFLLCKGAARVQR